jgi:hypothetical protein
MICDENPIIAAKCFIGLRAAATAAGRASPEPAGASGGKSGRFGISGETGVP